MDERPIQLQVDDIHLSFGGVNALMGVGFQVYKGEIFSIIGPNGAGKTSMLNCISGRYHPQRGRIVFEGREITNQPPATRAEIGISRTFQNIALFKGMTVLDNLLIGRHIHLKTGFLKGGIYLGPCQREEIEHRKFVEDIIDFLEIEHIRKKIVGTLAYGLQKRVELARALALDPKLILLDEPMAGMNLEETEDMVRYILDINQERGITVILVEHDMGVVMDISDRIVVLDFGQKIGEGTPDEVQKNPDVVRAYLGAEDETFLGR
ncbi:MAG: ABC transporter ATP-binding protein [Deltaproteobacteria bacterium]|nr:ABC transporter ATP-binding protein [Deltaproteobacteria bacterium]